MELYLNALKYFEQVLGKGPTSTDQLLRLGQRTFGEDFRGVFARDEDWRREMKRGYVIVNLDTSDLRGSHWVAVAGGLVYDSFGRVHVLGAEGDLKDVDRDAEQRRSEDNCGQRCLAWLTVYRICGRDIAQTI